MGTGYSLDPSEYHAAAGAIEGYGSQQADNGSALASGTSTPLSSSNSGIAGAISQIATSTVQKIVTDVTATTKGFADDTAKGLRAQATHAEQLETELADNAKSILNGSQSSLLGGLGVGGLGGASGGGLTGFGTGGTAASLGSPVSSTTTPLDEGSTGAGESETGAGESAAAAGLAGEEGAQESSMAMPMGGMAMRGGAGAAGATEERGQRPDYLKSKAENSDSKDARTRAVSDAHLKECGVAPIPLGKNQLVCAKCGSILTVEDEQAIAEPAVSDQ